MFEIIFQFYYHIYFEILDNTYIILFMNIKFSKLRNIFEKYLLRNIRSKFITIIISKN